MTLEKEIEKFYDDRKPATIHLYLRPILILFCCITGFYAFRVIILDYITGKYDINVYAAENRMEEGNFIEAEEILKQVLVEQPNYSTANTLLGFLYLQQDKLDEALTYYKKAQMYSPQTEKIESAILLINKRINENASKKNE